MDYGRIFYRWNFEGVTQDFITPTAPNGRKYCQLTIKKGTLLWRTSSVEEDISRTRANPSWYSFDLNLSLYYGNSLYVTLYRVKEDITKILQWEYSTYTPGFDSDPSLYLDSFFDVFKFGREIPMRHYSTTFEQSRVIQKIRSKDFNGWVNFHSEEIILMDALDYLEPLHLWVKDKDFLLKTYYYIDRRNIGLPESRVAWNPQTDGLIMTNSGTKFLNTFTSQTVTYADEYTYRTQFYQKLNQQPFDFTENINDDKNFDFYNSRRCLHALFKHYTRYDYVEKDIPHRSIRLDRTYMGNEKIYLEKYLKELGLGVSVEYVENKLNLKTLSDHLSTDPILYVVSNMGHYYFVYQNKQLFYTPYPMSHLKNILSVKSTAKLLFCEAELPSYNDNPIPALTYLLGLMEGLSNKNASKNSRKKSFRQALRDILDEYMKSEKTFNVSEYFKIE